MGILGDITPSPTTSSDDKAASILGSMRAVAPPQEPGPPPPPPVPRRVSGHDVMRELPQLMAERGVRQDSEDPATRARQMQELAKYSVGAVKSMSDLATLLATLMGYAEHSGYDQNTLSGLANYVGLSEAATR